MAKIYYAVCAVCDEWIYLRADADVLQDIKDKKVEFPRPLKGCMHKGCMASYHMAAPITVYEGEVAEEDKRYLDTFVWEHYEVPQKDILEGMLI